VELALSVVYLLALVQTRSVVHLAERVALWTPRWWIVLAVVVLALGVGYRVLTLPLAWLGGFWLPRRYGLLHQSLGRWLWDAAKAAVLGGAIALIAVEVVYALMRWTAWWWLSGAAIFLVGYALLALIAPVWLVPLFYRLTPLPDGPLRSRLLALAARVGVPVTGVFVVDQSRKSRTANAAVTGLGRTRRILLFDTLLDTFTPDEVEAVLAHELAHQLHGDIRRGLLVQGALTLVTLRAAAWLLAAGVAFWHLEGVADPAGLPWLALVMMLLGAVQMPLANGFSRWIERQADDFALGLTRDPAAFIGAMERLGTLNLAERRPHRLKEIVLYSHPALDRRIARAREGEGTV
jgi:STE24 endopeptidase